MVPLKKVKHLTRTLCCHHNLCIDSGVNTVENMPIDDTHHITHTDNPSNHRLCTGKQNQYVVKIDTTVQPVDLLHTTKQFHDAPHNRIKEKRPLNVPMDEIL